MFYRQRSLCSRASGTLRGAWSSLLGLRGPREGGEEQPELSAEQQAEAQHQREKYVAELEKLIEATSLGVGVRVIVDGRQAVASTSDISEAALDETVATVMELAGLAQPIRQNSG